MSAKSYKLQKKAVVTRLEHNPKEWAAFEKWLDKQELDIEFFLYEDTGYEKDFMRLYRNFQKSRRKK